MLVIKKPNITKNEGKSRVSVEINIDKDKKGRARIFTETLWFEVDDVYEKYLVHERSDAFLIGILQYAMRYKHDIILEAPITGELLYNLKKILIPTLCRTSSVEWHDPTITAEILSEPIENAEACGTGMSCGVDSFHSALQHLELHPGAPKLTHLFVSSFGSFDVNYVKVSDDRIVRENLVRETIYSYARSAAKELNLQLIESNTNIYELYSPLYDRTHTFNNTFAIYSMAKLFKTYLWAGGISFADFQLHKHNKRGTAYYDLLSTSCFTTRHLRFYSEGSEKTRVEKTLAISDSKVVQNYLHVCTNELENCGKCPKCRRTMTTLAVLGKLEKFEKIFPIHLFFAKKNLYFKSLAKSYLNKEAFALEIYPYAMRSEYADLFKSEISKLNSAILPDIRLTEQILKINKELNLRKGPGKDYILISKLPIGTTIKLLGFNNNRKWSYVKINNETGWIKSSLVNLPK